MKVLVTGSRGFLGSWLVEDFRLAGHDVFALSRSETNLLEKDQVKKVLERVRPDCIVHAAGLVGGIQANMANNFGFLYNNLTIGANLVSAAIETEIPKFLNISSSCIYPPEAPQPFKESQVLTGALEKTNEGYALAKISTQKLVDYASYQFGLDYRTLIPSNLYGPRDNFNPESSHMLAAILFKLGLAIKDKQNVVEIWGDGSARREFTYVGDLSYWVSNEAINLISTMPQALNVGFGSDYSVSEYYSVASQALSYQGEFTYLKDKPTGMIQKLMDSSLANALGWKPTTDLTEGIRLTVKWMEKNVEILG